MDYKAVLEEQIEILRERQKELEKDRSDDGTQKIITLSQQIHYLVSQLM